MGKSLLNRLHFTTNRKTILAYLKSKPSARGGPPEFSLNAIRQMPEGLLIPPDPLIQSLSQLNAELPELDEATSRHARSAGLFSAAGKASRETIQNAIESAQQTLAALPSATERARRLNDLDQALDNYTRLGFFTSQDWGLHHWGTPEDIQAVTAATFTPTTTAIEFETAWTPPLKALQVLADTFPSVKFKLEYCLVSASSWSEIQFFPFPPFGY